MNKEELKQKVCEAIDRNQEQITAIGDAIYAEPELGYKEVKTAAKIKKAFDELGLEYTEGWGITGLKARMKGRQNKRTVALFGEMDAVICRAHRDSDPVTGAAHCCGHNVQVANMLGVAMAFKQAGIMQHLDGDVVFFGMPAEEFVQLEYRQQLRDEKKIRYFGGKQEVLAQGGFDDIDMALQMHVAAMKENTPLFNVGASCNGFIGKVITYEGRAAHAAGAPDLGINALNAAMMGIMGVNAIRERFREADCVRFHPIITAGGDLVNVVPEHVKMESYVRAANVQAMHTVNADIDRALKAGADAVGARCCIQSIPGYLPLCPDEAFRDVLTDNAQTVFGTEQVGVGEHSAGSTDMGDISHVMPVVHPWIGCVKGILHGADYELFDRDVAYNRSVKVLAMTIIDLLYDQAEQADRICRQFKPQLNRAQYVEMMDQIK